VIARLSLAGLVVPRLSSLYLTYSSWNRFGSCFQFHDKFLLKYKYREVAAHKMLGFLMVRILRDLHFSCCAKNKTTLQGTQRNIKNVNHAKYKQQTCKHFMHSYLSTVLILFCKYDSTKNIWE
jgi:hypothetical protein